MTIHVFALLHGHAAVQQKLLTPTIDMIFSVPMTFVAVCFWWFRREVSFRTLADRIAYYVVAVYFTFSVPLHVQTMVTRNTSYIDAFPGWYSWFILPIMVTLFVFLLRIRFVERAAAAAKRS